MSVLLLVELNQVVEVKVRHVPEEIDDELWHEIIKSYLGEFSEFNLLAIMRHVVVVSGQKNVLILQLLLLELLD